MAIEFFFFGPQVAVVTIVGDAVHMKCIEQVQDQIRDLDLTDVSDANVVVQKLPWVHPSEANDVTKFPRVIVSGPGTETQNATAGTVTKDELGYPVVVSLIQKSNRDQTSNHDRLLLWREKVNREFRQRALPNVSEVFTCRVEPAQIIHPEAFRRGVDHSALVLRFFTREARDN